MQPHNRLEVLNEGQSPPLPPLQDSSGSATPGKMRQQRTGHTALRKDTAQQQPDANSSIGPVNTQQKLTSPEAKSSSSPSAKHRQVWLTTVNRDQPLKRYRRDIARSRQGQERRDRERRAKEDVDVVDECAQTTAAFNQLLNDSVRKPRDQRRSLAVKVVGKMRSASVPMDVETYNWLLHLLQDSADQECFAVFEQMKAEVSSDDSSLRPDAQTFRILLRACERCGEFQKAFQLVTEMKDVYGIMPDTTMYNTLLGFCVLKRDENQASELFEEMKERSVKPNVHTYNCLMNVFSESPAELLAQMFEDMLRQNIAPNLRTYNALMRSCQRTGDYDRAFKLFEELKAEGLQPDVVTYNILIDMCRERLDYVQGKRQISFNRRNKEQQESGMRAIAVLSLSLFNEMDEREIRPNTFTYNALMGVLARCADARIFTVFRALKEDAHEEQEDRDKLQELLDSGDLQDSEGALLLAGLGDLQQGVLIDDRSGAALRGHYQRLLIGDDYQARASAFGVKADITTYHTLLVAAERMGKAETAYDIFKEMKDSGIQPDTKTYMKMMDVCVLHSETGRALSLFKEASEHMPVPDVALYNSFLNVLAEAGDVVIFDAFKEIGSDTSNLNIKPNQQTYNTLIKACTRLRRQGDPGPDDPLPTDEQGMSEREQLLRTRSAERSQKAFSIYAEMVLPSATVQPNTETYSILMDVCCLSTDTARARSLLDDMRGRAITPTITTYNKMLNVFFAAGDPAITDVFTMLKAGYVSFPSHRPSILFSCTRKNTRQERPRPEP